MTHIRFALYALALLIGTSATQTIVGYNDQVLALSPIIHHAQTSRLLSTAQITKQSANPIANSNFGTSAGRVLGTSTVQAQSNLYTPSDVQQLITSTFNELLAQGRLNGPQGAKGDKGDRGDAGIVQNPSISPGYSGTTPYNIYPAPAPYITPGGISLFSATDLSGQRIVGNDVIVTNSLTVNGASAFTGKLTVGGTITGNVAGSINPGFTAGSVVFQGASGLAQDNANFFFDATNHRLGIGTITPTQQLDVNGSINTSDIITKGPLVDVRAYGAKGDGVTNDTAAFNAAIAAIGSSEATLLLPRSSGQYLLSNLTIPGNVTITTTGGAIKIVTGQTVTIAGAVSLPLRQVFYNALSGQGTVSFSGNESIPRYYPQWWGAIGDGTTDNYASFRAAYAAMPAKGVLFLVQPPVSYRLNFPAIASPNGLSVSKDLTIRSETPSVKIKLGPETPTFTGAGELFLVNSGVNFTIDNGLTVEGPDADNNKEIIAVYALGDGGNNVYLNKLTTTKMSFPLFVDHSTTLATGVKLTLVDSNIAETSSLSNTYVNILVGDFNTVKVERGFFSTGGGGSGAHCFYIYTSSNVMIDGATIGPCNGYGIHLFGGTTTTGNSVLINNVTLTGTMGSGGILTNINVPTQITNSSFLNTGSANGIYVRGTKGVLISNSSFLNSGIKPLNNNATDNVLIQNSRFDSSPIFVSSSDATAGTWTIDNSSITGTSDYLVYHNYASNTLRLLRNTFTGGVAADGQVYESNGTLSIIGNIFNNAGVVPAVRLNGATVSISGEENTFQTPQYAFYTDTQPAYAAIRPKRATCIAGQASANSISFDWNCNAFQVTGVTTVNSLAPLAAGLTNTTYPAGDIIIFAQGAFAFGNTGNIKAAAGAVTVDRNYQLSYNRELGFWYQSKVLGTTDTPQLAGLGIGTVGPSSGIALLTGSIIQPSADSTNAINFTKANGTTSVLSIDTTNSRIGIGTTTPQTALSLASGGVLSWEVSAGSVDTGLARNAAGVIEVNNGTAGTYRDLKLRNTTYTGGVIQPASNSTTAINFTKADGSTSVLDIDSTNGRVGIGTTGPTGNLDVVGSLVTARVLTTGSLSLIGTDTTASAQTVLTLSTGVANATGPNIVLSKSRSQSSGAVTTNDVLGTIQFQGGNGSASVTGAQIQAKAFSPFTGTEQPTYLSFFTAAQGNGALTERMRIDHNGNIGINTTSEFGSGTKVIGLANATTDPTTNPTAGGVLYASSGALKWRGSSGTVTQIAAADYAEDMPTNDPSLSSAEVVAVSPVSNPAGDGPYNKFFIQRASKAYDPRLVGVVSSFMDQAQQPATSRPVALVGRVPVKVSIENGPIDVGDYLTASGTKSGYAMKAIQPGRVIGQALQRSDADGEKILVFVNPAYYIPSVATILQNNPSQDLIDLNMTDASAFDNLVVTDTLYVGAKLIVNGTVQAKEFDGDTARVNQLCVGSVCVTQEQFLRMVQQSGGPDSESVPPAQPQDSSSPSDSGNSSSPDDGSTNSGDSTPTTP